MDELSSQPDGSRKNDYMHKMKEYLGDDNSDVFDCFQAITGYIDDVALPEFLSELSHHSKYFFNFWS